MNRSGDMLVCVFVVGIVVVVVRYQQSAMGFGERMDNGHVAVEREGERRQENGKRIRRHNNARRPDSHQFPQGQHSSARLIGFGNRGWTIIGSDGCMGKVLPFGK